MKIYNYLFLIALFLFGCSDPNSCETLDCGLNGICNEANGDCDQFYDGTNCENEIRSKYLGTWSGTGNCGSNDFDLDINITQNVTLDGIQIQSEQILQNFTMSGKLDQDNNVVIPDFQTNISSNIYSGYIQDGQMSLIMTLDADVNGTLSTCTYIFNK